MDQGTIEARIDGLSERVRNIHNGSFVCLMYHTGRWTVSDPLKGLRGEGASPEEAADEFERVLTATFASYETLAATLGVV
jgi:hypothetical protein